MCNNSTQDANVDHTIRIHDDDAANYVVNVIVRSNNNDMSPNNDDDVNVNANCYYDATNNILSFYLLWQQVQVRVLDNDYNDINDNNLTYNNPFEYDTHEDNNDVPTDICEFDTDCDCYNDYNNNSNIITGDYDNYDEDNNNHVDCYDVGIVQIHDLVANDSEENNYTTSLVPCVLSSSGTTSIVHDCDYLCET